MRRGTAARITELDHFWAAENATLVTRVPGGAIKQRNPTAIDELFLSQSEMMTAERLAL
jgi:hypothetical protein